MATPGALPQLDVFFEGGHHITWVNPTNYVCRSFNCPNMPKARFVGWADLPLHKVAAFYETPDCTYRDGYFTFNTGSVRSQVTGMHVFEGSKRIRSMMLGRNEVSLLEEKLTATSISQSCDLIENWEPFDSTIFNANETQTNATYEFQWKNNKYSGPSSNWGDILPDTPQKSGNTLVGNFDDEDAGI
ncbi:hypothetical protein PHMEG_0001830 [Phytophthora megakarya]|uniref:Uncharacterized protein n=1 Tax=Phytophthora megakarya TaxID=4795 RepID=A0A225X0W0_9STRA|nr:hypothetical protein PHMEG_0001830 [Phytophthora megakarya]